MADASSEPTKEAVRYKTVRAIGHPLAQKQGRVLEHRKVWFDAFGVIPDGFVIHHKNGDKRDNTLSNLEAMPRTAHAKEHYPSGLYLLNGDKRRVVLTCDVCGSTFTRDAHRLKYNDNRKATKHALRSCSKTCWGLLARAYKKGDIDKYLRSALKAQPPHQNLPSEVTQEDFE